MGVGLYTSRVVLATLGVDDFGIYNVVGGVVAMFSLLNGSLSSAVQRFLTFELGAGNTERLKSIFSSSLNILIAISIIIIIFAETLGLWFLNSKLNIPVDRLTAANWVYQISLLTFIAGVISAPYNAALVAHEDFKAYSKISILEVVLKLGVVLFLKISMSADKLILYAVLLLGVAVIIRLIYGFYCSKHYEECKYSKKVDIPLCKELFSFTGWSFIGSAGFLFKTQGISIILNMFFGVVVNTAYGIANQVTSVTSSFVNSFVTAVNPQITKSYASKNYNHMNSLVFYSSRFSFFLVMIFVVPVCVETEYILKIWLSQVPQYAVVFTQLVLITVLIDTLSNPLGILVNATGIISIYNIVLGSWSFVIVFLSYLFLKWDYPPQIVLIISCIISIFALLSRLLILQRILMFSIIDFFKNVIIRIAIVFICTVFVLIVGYTTVFVHIMLPLFHILFAFLMSIFLICFIGISKQERNALYYNLINLIKNTRIILFN
jgi:O-antigen/teichoic acid export membrane protein